MARLTKQQTEFIQALGLSTRVAFDATGLKRTEWQQQMRELNKLLAFGVTPCAAQGHELRTRSGHCVQCNTANLGYLLRHVQDVRAEVYVAWSEASKLAKIGYSKNADERVSTLNKWRYGGQKDWKMVLIYEVDKAIAIEKMTQDRLSKSKKQGITYMNGTIERQCTEIFECPLPKAIKALEDVIATVSSTL